MDFTTIHSRQWKTVLKPCITLGDDWNHVQYADDFDKVGASNYVEIARYSDTDESACHIVYSSIHVNRDGKLYFRVPNLLAGNEEPLNFNFEYNVYDAIEMVKFKYADTFYTEQDTICGVIKYINADSDYIQQKLKDFDIDFNFITGGCKRIILVNTINGVYVLSDEGIFAKIYEHPMSTAIGEVAMEFDSKIDALLYIRDNIHSSYKFMDGDTGLFHFYQYDNVFAKFGYHIGQKIPRETLERLYAPGGVEI